MPGTNGTTKPCTNVGINSLKSFLFRVASVPLSNRATVPHDVLPKFLWSFLLDEQNLANELCLLTKSKKSRTKSQRNQHSYYFRCPVLRGIVQIKMSKGQWSFDCNFALLSTNLDSYMQFSSILRLTSFCSYGRNSSC